MLIELICLMLLLCLQDSQMLWCLSSLFSYKAINESSRRTCNCRLFFATSYGRYSVYVRKRYSSKAKTNVHWIGCFMILERKGPLFFRYYNKMQDLVHMKEILYLKWNYSWFDLMCTYFYICCARFLGWKFCFCQQHYILFFFLNGSAH